MTPKKPKELRIAARLSQADVMRLSGLSLNTITRAEKSGKWPLQSRTRRALMAALGLTEQVAK